MKRPICSLSLAQIAGILAAYLTGSAVLIAASGFWLGVICFLYLSGSNASTIKRALAAAFVLFYLAGGAGFLYRDKSISGKYEGYYGEKVRLAGYICAEPSQEESGIKCVLRTERLVYDSRSFSVKGKILLSIEVKGEDPGLKYGDLVEVYGSIEKPKGARNPGGFNYRSYLAQQGISGLMYLREGDFRLIDRGKGSLIVRAGLAVRQRIVDVIEKSLPEEQAGLLTGMLIGYREGLSSQVEEVFTDAGLNHLMAASGMNVWFVAIPLFFLLKKLKLNPRLVNAIVILFLWFFAFVAGFSPSVVRAVVMASLVLLAGILWREPDIYASLAFTSMAMLTANPFTLFDIGFQLSFAATLSIVLFHRQIKKLCPKFLPRFVSDTLAVTLAAQAGAAPLTAFYFNQFSPVSLLSNLVVVPLVEAVTVLGFLMAAVGQISLAFSRFIGYANCGILSFILYAAKLSASIPCAVITLPTPSITLLAAYYGLVFLFLWYIPNCKPKVKPYHWAVAACCLLAALTLRLALPGRLEVVFLDVGEGDSAFIKTWKGTTVLIDGGGSWTGEESGLSKGENVVVPFLLDYGVHKLDLVVATHAHSDHIQGLIPVLEKMRAGCLVIPRCHGSGDFGPLLEAAQKKKVKVMKLGAGDRIALDKRTYLEVLHPEPGYREEVSALNNSSLVLKLYYDDISVLFAADIEKEAEEKLVKSGLNLRADILKVAHHGSLTSTSPQFVGAVRPKAAVISVGSNSFGHPSPAVIEELEKVGARLFRTDWTGAVLLVSDGKRARIKTVVTEE